jgi:quinol monooxygenase YgiN
MAQGIDPARQQEGARIMPKLAIMGTIDLPPGKRAQILPLLTAHKARSLRDEPGTLQFEIVIPRDDESKIILFEVYQDDAAFEAHRNAPSIVQWRQETAGMGVKVIATWCTVVE